MRIGDGGGTKFVELTRRDLWGCALSASQGKLACRTRERKDEGPTEVRQPNRACSESPCQASNGLLKGSAALQMLAIPPGMAVLSALQLPPIDHFLPDNDFPNRP